MKKKQLKPVPFNHPLTTGAMKAICSGVPDGTKILGVTGMVWDGRDIRIVCEGRSKPARTATGKGVAGGTKAKR